MDDPDGSTNSFENTSLVFVSLFQYLVICMVFSISKPFRQPIYTNLWFSLFLVILLVLSGYVVLSSDTWVISLFVLEDTITMKFRLAIVGVIGVNSIVSYIYERVVVWYVSQWWKNKNDRLKDKKLQMDIAKDQ